MKRLLLGAAIMAAAAFAGSGAFAADGTAYMAQCKANVAQMPKPQNGMPDMGPNVLKFCQCIVDTGDQKVIDEALALEKIPFQQRQQQMSTASDQLKAAYQSCGQKSFPPPPAGAGGGSP